MSRLQPEVKKEFHNIVIYTLIGVLIELIVLWLLHMYVLTDILVFDATSFAGAAAGCVVADLNFYLMALTVQKVAATEDDKLARQIMQGSYKKRMFMQIIWIIAAVAAPCFNMVAGIIPLLFPTLGIRVSGIINRGK